MSKGFIFHEMIKSIQIWLIHKGSISGLSISKPLYNSPTLEE